MTRWWALEPRQVNIEARDLRQKAGQDLVSMILGRLTIKYKIPGRKRKLKSLGPRPRGDDNCLNRGGDEVGSPAKSYIAPEDAPTISFF